MPTLPLTGTGGLFTRIGKLGSIIDDVNAHRGTDVPSLINSVVLDYQSADQDVINNLYSYLSSYQSGNSSLPSSLKSMAQSLVVEMVEDVSPQPSKSLSNAIGFIVRSMKGTGDTVKGPTISSSVTYDASNIGNPFAFVSMLDDTGLPLGNSFAEVATATVSFDSQTGGVASGSEVLTASTPYAVSDTLSWLYPGGSGSSQSFTAIDALASPVGGHLNWVSNGAMETWTVSNVPDGWHYGTGAAGTQFLRSTTHYDGSYSLSIVGDGTTLSEAYQEFTIPGGSSMDSPIIMYPYYQLGICLYLSVTGTSPSGILRVSLTDGTSVINDASGNANSFTVDVSTLTSSFTPHGGAFRLPAVIPARVLLELKLTTAIPSGVTLYVDRVSMSRMQSLYQGGPRICIFSGNSRMIKGDKIYVNISNNYAGKFQLLFDKLFNMKSLGYILPSKTDGTQTITDY